MTIQIIPALSCVPSTKNVRRTPPTPEQNEQFKADVAARGVLQNLIGFAIPKKRGKFEITAGGRRLAAVHALIEDGTFPKTHGIPVFVMNDTSAATETSLAENFQRLAMNPCDECTAFRHFIEVEGKTIEEVARRFGLTTRFVEGRIRLAGLAEEIFEALRTCDISLETAQAFGTTSDVARQSAVFAQVKGGYNGLRGISASGVRRMMTDETITGSHALSILVGRDAYVEAGGRIESDLFADAADEIWLDAALVHRLAEAKMAAAAAAVTGYANVVPVLAHRPDYDLTRTLRPVRGEPVPLSTADIERLSAIEAELEAIEENAEDPEGYEFTDEEDGRVERLQAESEALQNRIAPVDDETRAAATAFVVIGPDGAPTLHEVIYVEPQMVGEGGCASGSGESDAAEGAGPALGKPLRDELAVQRTELLGLHVANDPDLAINLAVFLLADAEVSLGRCFDRGSSLSGSKPSRAPFGYKSDGPIPDQLRAFGEALDYSWAEHAETGARFDAFRGLGEEQRGAWAGWTVARTLEPKLADEKEAGFHNHLGRTLGIDVAAWWRPTAANFFNRVRKGVVLDALAAIGGPELRGRYAASKKAELAAAAEKLCAGKTIVEAEIRAAATAWLPDVMTFGIAAEAAANAGEGDDVAIGGDEAASPNDMSTTDEDEPAPGGNDNVVAIAEAA